MRTRRFLTYLPLLLIGTGLALAQDDPVEEPEPILVGPARLDLNTRPGDQSQRQTYTVPETGSTIKLDVAISEGGANRSGFDIIVSYNPEEVAFQTAETVDLFTGAFLMPNIQPGRVGLTGLLLGEASSREAGSLAQLSFTVLDGFPGTSVVSLDNLFLGTALRIDTLQVGTQTSVVTLGGNIPDTVVGTPDFDGDGSVGFNDFIIFAGGFGAASGEQSFNPALDLDASGDVGFSDFLIFAQAIGT